MKQYIMGMITGASLIACVFMFMGADSKRMGDIEVNSIKVVDKNGRRTVHLGTSDDGAVEMGSLISKPSSPAL